MVKQRKIVDKNKTNINDILMNRELRFDRGHEEPPFEQSNEFKAPMTMCDQIKQMTREKLNIYLKAYKTNYELLNYVLHPKFRPPRHMLPFVEPELAKSRPRSCFYRISTDQLSLPQTSSCTSVEYLQGSTEQSKIIRPHSYPLKAVHNCISFPSTMRAHGLFRSTVNSQNRRRPMRTIDQ
ncbi:hypothetical protein KR093_008705 [Drosophila rubida]|uniref:Uncharacterized protein n=1 Tax=Drosophila rubida TaxID=30044 RepID=A0AAD4JU80_9MUSC|nr:hypothetical protein KR093_008705 [Drosophila rubida]